MYRRKKEELEDKVIAIRNEAWAIQSQLDAARRAAAGKSERIYLINRYLEDKRRIFEKRAEFLAVYDRKPVRFLFHMPDEASVVDGGFPVMRGWKREDYWVYITPHGNRFHRRLCPNLSAGERISVRVWDVGPEYTPCANCMPRTADFTWYRQLKQLERDAAVLGLRTEVENGVLYLHDEGSPHKAIYNGLQTQYSLKPRNDE